MDSQSQGEGGAYCCASTESTASLAAEIDSQQKSHPILSVCSFFASLANEQTPLIILQIYRSTLINLLMFVQLHVVTFTLVAIA